MLRLAVTGDASFASRHGALFTSMASRCGRLDFVTSDARVLSQRYELAFAELGFAAKHVLSKDLPVPFCVERIRRLRRRFLFSPSSFAHKSIITERNLKRLAEPPHAVLHIFGLYRPYWNVSSTPFAFYLDYTSALARRNWPPNVPYLNDQDFKAWFSIERDSYHRATHLFPMSELVARSLQNEYGVEREKITVVGSGGRLGEVDTETKVFGTKRVLFNGNPFIRKGGDIVLAAFEIVRERVPDATLVVIGTKLKRVPAGVINPGFVSDLTKMGRLFRQSDLVVAPALADPYPGFLIEALSHGVPCIASDVDGMPEIVDNGVNGMILQSSVPDTLANAIVALLGDRPRLEAYSRAAREKASAAFKWSRIAERIVDRLEVIGSSS